MRVVVSAAYGTWGDVQPMLALAAALAEQGHAVTCIVDGYWLDAASATRGVTVVTLGAADEYAAMLADAKLRWSKPQTLVHAWLSRLRQHYEARRQRRGVHLRVRLLG
jgi:UDP:flavonoid glycosyltransferase YjiC (YdhE family)